MATTKVSEALARTTRTGVQGGAGWVATEFVDAFIHHLNEQQYGILVVVLGAVFSFIQNKVEEKTGKAVLRKLPPKDVPVVEDQDKDEEVND